MFAVMDEVTHEKVIDDLSDEGRGLILRCGARSAQSLVTLASRGVGAAVGVVCDGAWFDLMGLLVGAEAAVTASAVAREAAVAISELAGGAVLTDGIELRLACPTLVLPNATGVAGLAVGILIGAAGRIHVLTAAAHATSLAATIRCGKALRRLVGALCAIGAGSTDPVLGSRALGDLVLAPGASGAGGANAVMCLVARLTFKVLTVIASYMAGRRARGTSPVKGRGAGC